RSPGHWSTATTWRGFIVMPRPGAATTCWPASADALRRADHPARDPAPAQGVVPHLVRTRERAAHLPAAIDVLRPRHLLVGVGRRRSAQLLRRDDRHGVVRDARLGRAPHLEARARGTGDRPCHPGPRL